MPNRLWMFAAISLCSILACSIGYTPPSPTPNISPTSSQRPTVTIQAPQSGADALVGEPITVQATSSHPDGVTRMTLFANDQAVDNKVSENPQGDQQFSAYLNYTPTIAGALTLKVVAYRESVASDPATLTMNVKVQEAQVTATVAQPAGITPLVTSDPTCRARVEVNGLNFRQGPGQNYPPLAVLSLGTVVPLTGKSADGTWWRGNINNTIGWVSAAYFTKLGNCGGIGVIQPPPSPTSNVTPTAQAAPSITATASLPDLVVLKIDGPVSITLSSANTASATYKVTVQNAGTASAGAFHVSMVMPDGTQSDMGSVPSLAAGQQAVFQTDITFTAPGSVRISAVIDPTNTLSETDKTNNIKVLDVVLIKAPPTSS